MKYLLVKYRLGVKFIQIFLLVYVTGTILYKFYLQYSDGSKYYPDYVTNLVAFQVKGLLALIGYTTEVFPNVNEPTLGIVLDGNYLFRIVEGCNSVSIIILFVSFVIAFSGKLRPTFFYIIAGAVLIYLVNLFRIVLFGICLYHFPEYSLFAHDIVFPIVIYGTVLILWVFWVNSFSKLKNTDD